MTIVRGSLMAFDKKLILLTLKMLQMQFVPNLWALGGSKRIPIGAELQEKTQSSRGRDFTKNKYFIN